MEYLEGETLSDRLAKGPLPLEQTLRYGVEIADALDKAHRQGIVHRDLKPGNVMLTKSGVKLLDFGLAKAMRRKPQSSSATSLPTAMGSGNNLTQEGTILGTFQYMAPEQLEGKEADGRTDIFAFGCRPLRDGDGQEGFRGRHTGVADHGDHVGGAARRSRRVQPMSPPALDRVVRTCLAKDPEDRWQSASDLKRELRWLAEGSQIRTSAQPARERRRTVRRAPRSRRGRAGAPGRRTGARAPPARRGRRRSRRSACPSSRRRESPSARSPPMSRFLRTDRRSPSSPGTPPVCAGSGCTPSTRSRLSQFRGLTARSRPSGLPTAGTSHFSPMENSARSTVLAAQALGDAPNSRGGAWGRGDVIVFAPAGGGPLMRIAASGGAASPATQLDSASGEVGHRFPSFLPDGRRFLYAVVPETESGVRIRLGTLEGPPKPGPDVVVASNGAVFPSRALSCTDGETPSWPALRSERGARHGPGNCDSRRFQRQRQRRRRAGGFGVRRRRARAGAECPRRTRLVWLDRAGQVTATIPAPPGSYNDLSMSPDGSRVLAVKSGKRG